MSTSALALARDVPPDVDITIPVHNEERDLGPAVRKLHEHLSRNFPFTARITIADNASTDGTNAIALRLANELSDVRLLRLNERGRGRALAAAWMTSDSRVVAYMDVDLSTDLAALLWVTSLIPADDVPGWIEHENRAAGIFPGQPGLELACSTLDRCIAVR